MATSTIASSKSSETSAGNAAAVDRLYSLDAFRGFTMVWMFSMAFGLHHVKNESVLGLPLEPLARQFTHADWQGMNAWDLIQPFFMFIVGVAMPYAFARRDAAGQSRGAQLLHVLKRCAMLLLLGTMARSIRANQPTLDLINVLGQLSFTYLAAYMVLRLGWKAQAAAAGLLLGVHWALYQFIGAPGSAGPWEKNANFGWWLDGVVLGKHWGGGYATINMLSSAANTIFGVMAGQWLRAEATAQQKIRGLALAGVASLAAGAALDPFIPIIKKIWTLSFALFSNGFCLLALALFYWVCDVRMIRRWAHLFAIVGMNSIFIYLFHEIMYRWMKETAMVFFGWAVGWWGAWGSALVENVIVAFQIYLCWWLWRRRIFFKL